MNLFIASLTLFFLTGCSTVLDVFDDNKFYYKSGFQRVQLDIEDKKTNNIHPVKIDPQRIEGALKLILTSFGTKPQQLFPNEKVYDYSIAISEALADAENNQDIVFTIEGWYKQKGLSDNRVTSGRIFYNKSGLNLIFGSILRKGNIQETDPMLKAGLNRDRDLEKNRYAPGSRFQTIKNKLRLSALPNSGVFRPRIAKNRKDWLVFSSKALRPRASLSRQEQTIALRSNIGVEQLKKEVQDLRRELQSVRSPYMQNGGYYPPTPPYNNSPYIQRPYDMNTQNPYQNNYIYSQPRTNNQGYYQQNPVIQPRNSSTNAQLTLKSLESMRERGLISEENYLKKLRELGF